MKILALETSTEYCSVALNLDGKIIERFEWVGQKHSELLIAMLADMLREADVKLADLDGIAYGAGPGSFTGVRIACGVTQGLALGANLPVFGVCTLQALTQAAKCQRVIAALDARMGEIYHAVYETHDGGWTTVSEPCLCKAEDAPLVEGDNWAGVGSGFATYGDTLQHRYAGHLQSVDGTAVPHAAAIAALAATAFAQGLGLDAARALPLYLRDKVALKTAERDALAVRKKLDA
ncbi:MAG: tRNA (adenosine(37)-N6)-threonylcarbamoyltransferase complex dimerization subunit type 1 TsaB [Gallionella sp.]|jgi:tRNA threonylcarbamoyladenosine biosynthesis protein TsaB|nr:tRNA (adenosine(37)-N6)-threonylcarbamoyltransferase complex dimerization subunit type 1 TsaB [Gallionella sp.]